MNHHSTPKPDDFSARRQEGEALPDCDERTQVTTPKNYRGMVYQVALNVPLRTLFDYLGPTEDTPPLKIGMRVSVPFGKKQRIGIIFQIAQQSQVPVSQLKRIDAVLDEQALMPTTLCTLIEKMAQYYHHPIGEVAFCGTPTAFRQGKVITQAEYHASNNHPVETKLALNSAQLHAFERILKSSHEFHTFLLEGVTGSGKTEVYLQTTLEILAQNKQVLILIPEISLSLQTYQRFEARFAQNIACYHSKMTPKQRWQTWLGCFHHQYTVIIGTRSAIFLPFQRLGMIIIDEEHDQSFKQQEGFRYSARDSAILRAQIEQCPIVLGSATPSFESLKNSNEGKYQRLSLPNRATQIALPDIVLLDVRHKKCKGGISPALVAHLKETLLQNGQALLFINRRGYAPTYMCYQCHWMANCHRCDKRLTYHHHIQTLICHHCAYQCRAPTSCPQCQQQDCHPVGQGTEKVEEVLQEYFPNTLIARIDSDATRKKGRLEALLSQAKLNQAPLLIGTQMLAKGHHFEHLQMVAILDADSGLFSVDFRAIEHMAQLLIQVAGRAGRAHHAGKVFIQTQHPDHPLLKKILKQDYRDLALQLLLEREQCQLPPYQHFALIRAHAHSSETAKNALQQIEKSLTAYAKNVRVLGPVASPMLKRQGQYHYQLLLQASERKPLHHLLSYSTKILEKDKLAKKVRWSIDVDPLEMI